MTPSALKPLGAIELSEAVVGDGHLSANDLLPGLSAAALLGRTSRPVLSADKETAQEALEKGERTGQEDGAFRRALP